MVRLRRIEQRQFLPRTSLDEVWEFLANPRTVAAVSPPDLGLRVTSEPPVRVYPGLIVTYDLEVLPRVRWHWVTEVTHIREGRLLVDEQRFGPFRMWHHEHHLAAHDGGVEVRDLITYALPLGPLGVLADLVLVSHRLERTFAFRRRVLAQRFGAPQIATD
jgi:ligand-binding SRPBCC domain-containing protein